MSELLSGRGGGTDAVVNVATVEFRFWAVVLTKKIGVAGFHFSTHGFAIRLFAAVDTE